VPDSHPRPASEAKAVAVFGRFGPQRGLFTTVLAEQAAEIGRAVDEGAPPLGPGAAPAARLRAFLAALADLAVRNAALLEAHEQPGGDGRLADPTYLRWHRHVTALLTEARPGDATLDAPATAHLLLAAFDGDLVRLLAPGGRPERLAAAVGALADAAVRPKAS
jgi:hypothetical protein